MVCSDEALSLAKKAVEKNLDLFIPGSRNEIGLPEFKLDKNQLQETVGIYRRRHAAMF